MSCHRTRWDDTSNTFQKILRYCILFKIAHHPVRRTITRSQKFQINDLLENSARIVLQIIRESLSFDFARELAHSHARCPPILHHCNVMSFHALLHRHDIYHLLVLLIAVSSSTDIHSVPVNCPETWPRNCFEHRAW